MKSIFKIFSLDPRSLALFRILLGVVVAWDGIWKLMFAQDFYTDLGVFPRIYWIEQFMSSYAVSIHLANGSLWYQVILFGIQTFAALSFAIGYRTKLSGLVAWFLVCSLHSRNYAILSGADDVIRLALLWALFLPVSSRFAVHKDTPERNWRYSLAISGWVFQIISVYIFTAIYKNHPIWMTEFTAVYYALSLDAFVTPVGVWLRDFPLIMKGLTFLTLLLEYVGPAAVLVPGWTRLLGSLSFIGFHFGLFLTMYLGFFPWILIVSWVSFFPAEFWGTKLGGRLELALDSAFSKLQVRLGRLANFMSSELWDLVVARFRAVCAKEILVIFLIVATFLYNLTNFYTEDTIFRRTVRRVGWVSHLYQDWKMFAPFPLRDDGWFVVTGFFADAHVEDVFTGRETNYDKPISPADDYPSSEWRKLMFRVWERNDQRYLLPLARYFCNKRSRLSDQAGKIVSVKIEFVHEMTMPPDEPPASPEIKTLWTHTCQP